VAVRLLRFTRDDIEDARAPEIIQLVLRHYRLP
jgi:hypothetical protein